MRKLKYRKTIGERLLELLASEGGATTRPVYQLAEELGVSTGVLKMIIHRLYVEGYLVRRDKLRTMRLAVRPAAD